MGSIHLIGQVVWGRKREPNWWTARCVGVSTSPTDGSGTSVSAGINGLIGVDKSVWICSVKSGWDPSTAVEELAALP